MQIEHPPHAFLDIRGNMFNVLEARDDDLARAEKTLMRLAVSRDDALERWFLLPGKKIKIKNRLDYCRMVAYRDDTVLAIPGFLKNFQHTVGMASSIALVMTASEP